MNFSMSLFVKKHFIAIVGLFVFLLFGVQLVNIVFGIELEDSGFHLVAYENIFDSPNSITYNFMYYLTNIVGGIAMKLFPSMGILGFRIMGAMCVLLAIVVIVVSLRNDIPIIHLLLGSALVVVCYVKAPYSYNNAIQSCCLYVLSIVSLYKGLVKDRVFLVVLGGIIAGLNIFSRMPNILAVGLVLIVLLYKRVLFKENVIDWKNARVFMIGVGMGVGFVLILMYQLGHLNIFVHSLKIMFSMAGGSGSHGLFYMMKVHFAFYLATLIPVLVFYGLFQIEKQYIKQLNKPIMVICLAVILLSIFYYVYSTSFVYIILWGICALGCFLCIIRHKDNLGLLAFLALFMLVVEIYGSDSGVNHGSLPALMAAPIASMQLIDRKKLKYVLIVIMAICWQVMKSGCFLDSGPIMEKTESINIGETKGILTTKEKALVVSSTLNGIKPFVSEYDTLICFPSAPMMNYLTHTRPAGGKCWIGYNGTFILPLEGTPKILFNKVSLSGNSIEEKNKIEDKYGFDIKSFILEHKYFKIYENPYFILFVPPIQ